MQLSALRRGVDVVVGTPGRIMDHIAKGTLDLSELKYLVLDEADEMLKMGFAEDVETILAETPDTKQVALFSATMPAQIRRISKQYLNDPAEITVKTKTTTSANTSQRYLIVSYPQKVDALTRILEVEDFEGLIIFVRTKSETETLAEKLRARGYAAAAISGDVAQAQRERTVNQLKSGKLDILVATDVAARGLDVDRITHVVNFDIPVDTESYVHRIGRTGRAGRSGAAISFVTPRERRLLIRDREGDPQPLTEMTLPTRRGRQRHPPDPLRRRDHRGARAPGRIDAFRDIIAHYVEHHDVPADDVAAALAVVAQGDTPLLLDPRRGRPAPPGGARRRERRDERKTRERRRRRPSTPLGPDDPVPHRGRPSAPRRAAPDRRRPRERGRPASRRLRCDPHPAGLLHRRAAVRHGPGDVLDKPDATPASAVELIEIKPDRRGRRLRRGPRDDRDDRPERTAALLSATPCRREARCQLAPGLPSVVGEGPGPRDAVVSGPRRRVGETPSDSAVSREHDGVCRYGPCASCGAGNRRSRPQAFPWGPHGAVMTGAVTQGAAEKAGERIVYRALHHRGRSRGRSSSEVRSPATAHTSPSVPGAPTAVRVTGAADSATRDVARPEDGARGRPVGRSPSPRSTNRPDQGADRLTRVARSDRFGALHARDARTRFSVRAVGAPGGRPRRSRCAGRHRRRPSRRRSQSLFALDGTGAVVRFAGRPAAVPKTVVATHGDRLHGGRPTVTCSCPSADRTSIVMYPADGSAIPDRSRPACT